MTAEIESSQKDRAFRVKGHIRNLWKKIRESALERPNQLALDQEHLSRVSYRERAQSARVDLYTHLRDLRNECFEKGYIVYDKSDSYPSLSLDGYSSTEGATSSLNQARLGVVNRLIDSRIKPDDYRILFDLQVSFSKEEYQKIISLLHERIGSVIASGVSPASGENERQWIQKWQKKLKTKKAERSGRDFRVLEQVNKVPGLVLNNVSRGSLRFAGREITKGIVSVSGLAGLVGGGVTGTLVTGALVGAVSGATIEYIRQVNHNLDKKIAATESGEILIDSKKSFLRKFRELRHSEVFKPNDYRKLLKATVFGGGAGLVGGFLADVISDHGEDIKSFFSGVKEVTEISESQEVIPEVIPQVENSPESLYKEAIPLSNKAISVYEDIYTLKSGDNVVGIAQNLAQELSGDQVPSNGDIYSLARRIALDNNIKSDFLKTSGSLDANLLRVGEVKLNLKGVKSLAGEMFKQE